MLFIFGECGGVFVDFICGVRERAVFFGAGVCFAASAAGFLWILFTACVSVPSFLVRAYVSRQSVAGFRGSY